MDPYEVLKLYWKGDDFICPLCKALLVAIPGKTTQRESALGLRCPKNRNHFSILTDGGARRKMLDNLIDSNIIKR